MSQPLDLNLKTFVVAKGTSILIKTIARRRNDSIKLAAQALGIEWSKLREHGYRCVPLNLNWSYPN